MGEAANAEMIPCMSAKKGMRLAITKPMRRKAEVMARWISWGFKPVACSVLDDTASCALYVNGWIVGIDRREKGG